MNETERRIMKFGEVYYMKFSGTGSEQRGWRPGLVYSNNVGNEHSPNIIALPLTTAMKKLGQPTHVFLPGDVLGMKRDSLVLCENPERMSKERVGDFIAALPLAYLADIAIASCLASSAVAFLTEDQLIETWKRAVSLNPLTA